MMDVKITPDMPLRVLKILRKRMKKAGKSSKSQLKQLDILIKKKQSEYHTQAENKAITNMIKFLQKAIP